MDPNYTLVPAAFSSRRAQADSINMLPVWSLLTQVRNWPSIGSLATRSPAAKALLLFMLSWPDYSGGFKVSKYAALMFARSAGKPSGPLDRPEKQTGHEETGRRHCQLISGQLTTKTRLSSSLSLSRALFFSPTGLGIKAVRFVQPTV